MATELAFNFQDSWDVPGKVPDLASLTLNNTTDVAKYWVVTVAGSPTPPLPGLSATFAVGDGAAWNGTEWVKIPYSDLALTKVLELDDIILMSETIGQTPQSTDHLLSSDTNCYLDYSVFTKWGKLKEINIITPTAGIFFLVHFRKIASGQWKEFARYNAASTVSSASVYNKISASSLSTSDIEILPGDCFGFFKRTGSSTSAIMGRNESIPGKITQIAVLGGDGKFGFTNANFPGSSGTSSVAGREMGLNIVLETNAIEQINEEINVLQTSVGQNTSAITALQGTVGQNTSAIATNASAITTLQGTVGQNTSAIAANASAITTLQGTVGQNTSAITTLQGMVGQNTSAIATNASAITTLQDTVGQNTSAITALQADIAEHTTDIDLLQTEVAQHTTDIGQLQTDVTGNTADIEQLQADVTGHTADLNQLQTDVTQNTTDIGLLQTDVNEHTTSISELQTVVGEHTSDISQLQTQVTQHTADISELESEVALNTSDIAALKSKIFVVPIGFDWNVATNVSPLANTECIISYEHNIQAKVNLPNGIQLRFLPGGKFNSAITNKMPSFNLSSGWTTLNNATIVNSNTFSVTGADGIVRKTGVLQQDSSFTIRIKGAVTTGSSVRVYSGAGAIAFTPVLTGTFDVTVTTIYTGTDSSIMLRAFNPGTVTIDNFEVLQGGFLDSPCDYGSTDEKSYPLIDNVSGFNFINGSILNGMFKATDDKIRMSDYFAGDTYPVYFYDSFVRTEFVIDKTFTQTWYPRDPVNANQLITQPIDKNYRGLSEGCGIQGTTGAIINNFGVYATGDFYIKGLTANTGRVNICSFYNRPLKLEIADCTFTNVGVDNTMAHPVVTSVILEANIRDSSFLMNLPEPPVQMVFQFLSVINSRISNCRFAYPNYVPVTGKGQPIIILSSVNSIYENNVMDKGDSGLVFFLAGDSSDNYKSFIESHAMDFKGFENNIIRGNTMYNMSEEAISFDSSDSLYPTVTVNRSYFTVLSVTDSATDSRVAAVQLKNSDSANYVTFINTLMTSITKGKFGKYCKIVKIERAADDTDFTKFSITGSAGFFKGAVAGDKYAVTYGLFNNIIENNSFVNCMMPVSLYMYSFHNIIRGNNVFGSYAINSAVAGCVRLLSYSARRNRCYIAPSIDNVIENNVFTGNGLLVVSAKNPTEWRNTWLNADPEPYDPTIAEEADLNTIVRGNVFKNTAVKLQGLSGCVFEKNQLIGSGTEITGTTFYSDMWNLVNESENIGIDNLFAQADMMGSMLIPLLSKGDGSGYIKLKIGLAGDVTVRTTGNAFLYNDANGTGKSSSKTFTGTIADIYVRCLSGDAQIIISNAINITALGTESEDFLRKYDSVNSPDIYLLKVRYLPRNLTFLKQINSAYSINLRGNIANLPRGLSTLVLQDAKLSLLDGDIKDFPASLLKIHLKYPLTWPTITIALRGDLANLPPQCTYFYDETVSGIYTYSQRSWTTLNNLHIHVPSSNLWPTGMVNQFLKDVAACTWTDDKSLFLANASPEDRAPFRRTTDSNDAFRVLVGDPDATPPLAPKLLSAIIPKLETTAS